MKTGQTIFNISRFTVAQEKEYVAGSYEHAVHVTSKLIKRSYIATHKLLGDWPTDKIIERYELCTKHAGTMPGDVKWWWLRKQEKTTPQPTPTVPTQTEDQEFVHPQ